MENIKINLNTIKSNSKPVKALKEVSKDLNGVKKIPHVKIKKDLIPSNSDMTEEDKSLKSLKNENNLISKENIKSNTIGDKNNLIPSDLEKNTSTLEESPNKKNIKLNINSIKAGNSEKIKKEKALLLEKSEKEAMDIINKKKEKEKENQATLFDNYESIFKKEKFNILEHIKKLKKLPTTNLLFLSILIALTIGGISFLFQSNPEVHNLNNYKTSIIDTYNALKYGDIEDSNITKKEKINKGGYLFDINIEKIKGKDIYIYNGKYYENKNELDKIIEKEINILKKSKVKNLLKNSFF